MYESRRDGISVRLAAMRLYYSIKADVQSYLKRGDSRAAQDAKERAAKALKLAKRPIAGKGEA